MMNAFQAKALSVCVQIKEQIFLVSIYTCLIQRSGNSLTGFKGNSAKWNVFVVCFFFT